MINKKNLLTAAAVMCVTLTSVFASDLTQIDIKKTSDSSVDVTFYTTGTPVSPMVTRKSSNKYVVLMPNVAGKNAGVPDLSAVKDVISSVDVKNVDDGMSGYTKVTFITTKPININTHTQKSAPISSEEKQAKSLIAQAKTHPKQTVAPIEPKKEVTKTTVTSAVSQPAKSPETKPLVNNSAKSVSNQAAKVPEKSSVKNTESKPAVQDKVSQKTVSKKVENKTTQTAKTVAPIQQKVQEQPKFDVKEVEKIEKISKSKPQSSSNNYGWALSLIPILGLIFLAKFIRTSVQRSIDLRESFKENLSEQPNVLKNYDGIMDDSEMNWQERYKKFVEESKEKTFGTNVYSSPAEAADEVPVVSQPAVQDSVEPVEENFDSAEEVSTPDVVSMEDLGSTESYSEFTPTTNLVPEMNGQHINESIYNKRLEKSVKDEFILKEPEALEIDETVSSELESDLSAIDKKRLALENTLSKTPEIYKQSTVDITNEPVSAVKSEDETISKGLVSLKAFAKPASLNTSNRNRVRHTLPETIRAKEGRHVNLENTPLSSSSRKFGGANLSVNDLISTGSKYLQENNKDEEMVNKEQGYIMSSIDEYFALLDKEKSPKMPKLSLTDKVASSLASVKPSMYMRKQTASRHSSNPIAQSSRTSDYMNGLIVKAGYNIDENRGFYLVNLDGVSALVGRIGEDVTVLKKFDEKVEKMQVRLDSDNVYMVKAGDFKSLVDVTDSKMGVLIEL